MHFEVVDQTVSLTRALQETSDVQPSDILNAFQVEFTCRCFHKCSGIGTESHYYQCSNSNNPSYIIFNTKKEMERETRTTVFWNSRRNAGGTKGTGIQLDENRRLTGCVKMDCCKKSGVAWFGGYQRLWLTGRRARWNNKHLHSNSRYCILPLRRTMLEVTWGLLDLWFREGE